MISFTEIEQFRQAIRAVKTNHDYKGKDETGAPIYLHDSDYPVLKFNGTVKLHGTNASVVKYADGRIAYQSRERELSLEHDNYGFMLFMMNKTRDVIEELFKPFTFKEHCAIYGEWCGQGIQSGVAISQLPKMFVIFGIKIDGVYLDMKPLYQWSTWGGMAYWNSKNIYNIYQFENYGIVIDFNNPEMSIEDLVQMTKKVEQKCPVGAYFGVDGIGEGIVWEHISVYKPIQRYIFKVKGEKHQSSKVKTLAPVDVEQVENIKKFVEYAVTESRLKQGIDKMRELEHPIEPKSTGEYLRWVFNDILKEEQDTIVKNNIDIKKAGSAISNKARVFWLNYLKQNLNAF